MKNLTTILSLAALAACSNNTTTAPTEPAGDLSVDPGAGPNVTPIYDVGASVISQIGGNTISQEHVIGDGAPFWTGDIVLPPNSTTRVVLDAETFVTEDGFDLELALEPVLTGDYLVSYEFPFVGGVEITDWASLRPDSFRAWAGTTSVGFTRDSIAPFIDYCLPTNGEAVTGLIQPGTGAGDAILNTVETDAVRATVVLVISNLEDGYLDLRATATATEAP